MTDFWFGVLIGAVIFEVAGQAILMIVGIMAVLVMLLCVDLYNKARDLWRKCFG